MIDDADARTLDAMRVNLSVAVVEMVHESANFTGRDGHPWTEAEQGNVLGSFFYG